MSSEKALSSENLITQSQFSGWAELTSPTVTAAYTNGPDGSSNTATRLQSASGANRFFYSTATSWTSGQQYTVSCWVKSNTGVAQTFAFFLPTTAYASADLTTHATDWTRITATFTAATSSIYCGFKLLSANTTDLSIWGFQVNTGANALDYQATSGSIHREFAPTLKTSSAGEPRFEYDASGNSEGLLIEAQATNLQTYSSDFTSWSGQNRVTTTSNVAIAPNGLLEADIVIANTSSTQSHNLSDTLLLASGTTYTASVYAKDAGQRYIQLSGSTGAFGSSQYATFDLQTGSVDTTGVTASAVSVGNGWWRIQATMTATASVTGGASIGLANSATASRLPLFAGNEYDGIILFGYQLEVGSAASSLISTSGAAATRSADSCSLVSAPLLDNGSGGLVTEYDMQNASDTSYVLHAERSTGATNGGGVAVTNRYLIVENTYGVMGVTTSNVFHKVAASWESGSQKASRDGGAIVEDTATVVPSNVNTLHIGTRQDGNEAVNGHIRNIAIYSEPLSSTNLTTLSQL